MIQEHSISLKKKDCRYFQKYDAKFVEFQNSWKRQKKIAGSKPPCSPKKATVMHLVSTPTSSQAPTPLQLKYGTMSREYHSLQHNSSLFCDIFGAQAMSEWLADEMWSMSLITREVWQQVTLSSGAFSKNKQLLDALCSQISINAENFKVFLKILHKEPSLEVFRGKLIDDMSILGKNSK